MDVEGLDVKTKYTCTFTDAANKNYKKVSDPGVGLLSLSLI